MQETLQGVKKEGTWEEVVEFGEQVEASLSILFQDNRIKAYDTELSEFREWRPKIDELHQEKDVQKKTAEQISVESPETNSREELSEAKDSLKDATQAKNSQESVSDIKESLNHAKKATQNGVTNQVKNVEEFVYENVMIKVSPTFFDNQLISANFQKSGEEFIFEVNIDEDELVDEFQEITQFLEEKFSRWHIQMEEQVDIDNATEDSDIDVVKGEQQETTTKEQQFNTLSEVKKKQSREKFIENQEYEATDLTSSKNESEDS